MELDSIKYRKNIPTINDSARLDIAIRRDSAVVFGGSFSRGPGALIHSNGSSPVY